MGLQIFTVLASTSLENLSINRYVVCIATMVRSNCNMYMQEIKLECFEFERRHE